MAVLELHRGGRDPVELARLEEEAMHAMTALAEALSPSDQPLQEVAGHIAAALELRVGGRRFREQREARKRELDQLLGGNDAS